MFATPFFKEKGNGFEALLRYDSYVPDKANTVFDGTAGVRNRTIAGIAYWFQTQKPASVSLLVDYEAVTYDETLTTPKPDEKRYALHSLFSF